MNNKLQIVQPVKAEKILFIRLFAYLVLFAGHSYSQSEINPAGQLNHPNAIGAGNQFPTPSLNGSGLCFTPNMGQIADMNGKTCPDVLYKGDGGGADIYLRKTGISYVYTNMGEVLHIIDGQVEELIKAGALTTFDEKQKKDELLKKERIKIHRVDMDFENCKTDAKKINDDRVDGYTNYYYPHCPQGITGVPQFNKVMYKEIYNNIDLIYYGDKQNGIKYDLIVQPHADPSQIKLRWKGAESIHIDRDGILVIKTGISEFTESIPKVYQNIEGDIVDVKAHYSLTAGENHGEAFVTFEFGDWDPEYALVIDPWATYYGGNTWDLCNDIATDKSGNAVITGYSYGSNFPANNSGSPNVTWQSVFAGTGIQDAIVVKFDANGKRLWATYYGGSDNEYGQAIATDNSGNVLILGITPSNVNFPIGNAGFPNVTWQSVPAGMYDSFIAKFDASGNRLWATFYGGNKNDFSRDIATDNNGNVLIAGFTGGGTFPANNAGGSNVTWQPVFGGGAVFYDDGFIAKFDANGNRLWSSYYGGDNQDACRAIATDNFGNVVIAGYTASNNSSFPQGNAGSPYVTWQSALIGVSSAFIAKFDPNGNRLWGTYYSGDAESIATDNLGNLIISGNYGAGFDATNAGGVYVTSQAVFGGGVGMRDICVMKFDAYGNRLWATYCGGIEIDTHSKVAVDENNNIYLLYEEEDAVTSNRADACSWQPVYNGGVMANIPGNHNEYEDQLLVKFNPNGKKLCTTYIGGTGEDDFDFGSGGISIFGNSLYIAGNTDGGFPVTAGTAQTVYGGGSGSWDVYVTQICTNICEGNLLNLNFTADNTTPCANSLVTFTPSVSNSCDTSGYSYKWMFTGGTPSVSTSNKPSIVYSTPGTYPVKLVVSTPCKKDSIIKSSYITINSCSCVMSATADVTANESCSGSGDGIANVTVSSGSGGLYTYSWSNGSSAITTATSISLSGLSANTYTVTVSQGTCAAIATIMLLTQSTFNINSITVASPLCFGANNGSATVSISSSLSAPYTFNWSNGASSITNSFSNTSTGLSAGTYTVTVTKGACMAISTLTITQPPQLFAGIFIRFSCVTNTGIATAFISGGTAPFSYLWSNGQTGVTATGLSLGTSYTVTVTDAGACTLLIATTTAITPMTLSTVTNLSCTNNGSATVSVTGGAIPYSYSWSNSQTTNTATGLSVGSYTVTITDLNSCTNSTSVIISPAPSPPFSLTSIATTCGAKNGSVTIQPTSGVSPYTWITSPSVGGGTFGTNYTISNLSAATYTVTLSDASGCSKTGIVTVPSSVNPASATFTYSNLCVGKPVVFTHTGSAGTYNWFIESPVGVSGTTADFTYTFLAIGTYTVSHTVSNGGCTSTVTKNIVVTTCMGPIVTATGNSTCTGKCTVVSSAASNGASPYTYLWSTGETSQNINPCPLATTTYSLTITDSGGATATTSATVTVTAGITAGITATNIVCNGGTGTATAAGSSGSLPYTYSWSNGGTTSQISNLTSQIYTVTVTDAGGCSTTTTAVILSPPALSGRFTKGTAICSGCGCKEWLLVNAAGGTRPYTYTWPDGYNKRYKNQLCPRAYLINIKDKNGCSINVNLTTP